MAKQTKIEVSANMPTLLELDESMIKLPLGRPVNPDSKRQKQLAEYKEKKEQGLLHRGRPVDPTSPSHQAKAEREEKRKNKGELKRGRPVDPNSPRQQRLQQRNVRIRMLIAQNGANIQNGRLVVGQMQHAIITK